jgi:RNA polymerase sigma-70 factor (ECF subfamily)
MLDSGPTGGPSDAELVAAFQTAAQGDLSAFESLVERYESQVAANCRHMVGSAEDAQDLKQEIFLKAYFALPRFEGRSTFKTWLWRIKIHRCLRFLEQERGRWFLDIDSAAARAAPVTRVESTVDKKLDEESRKRVVAEILEQMPDQHRVILVLRYMDQLSYEEIAETLGIGLSAVKMRLKRARDHFAQIYRAAGEP